MNIKQIVAFSILMQNGEGIIDKSPDYILEKFEACKKSEKPEKLLDPFNRKKYHNYLGKWLFDVLPALEKMIDEFIEKYEKDKIKNVDH